MRGQVAKRTTAHFGWTYDYERWRIESASPIPQFLIPVRARAAEVARSISSPGDGTRIALFYNAPGLLLDSKHRDCGALNAPAFGTGHRSCARILLLVVALLTANSLQQE